MAAYFIDDKDYARILDLYEQEYANRKYQSKLFILKICMLESVYVQLATNNSHKRVRRQLRVCIDRLADFFENLA